MSGLNRKLLCAVIVLLSFAHGSLMAQSKQERKLEKCLTQKKFEKCNKLATKYSSKSGLKELGYLYKTLVSFESYNLAKNQKDSIRLMKTTLQLVERCEKVKVSAKYEQKYKELFRNTKLATGYLADNLYSTNKKAESKYFYQKMAGIYKDTTSQYLVFFSKKAVEADNGTFEVDSLSILRVDLIKTAQSLVGIKYKYGGEDTKGFDCSGFVKYVYAQSKIELPHNANMQSKLGEEINLQDARPGDMIFFGSTNKKGAFNAYHAGLIYKNIDGKVDLIHCVSRGVAIDESGNSINKYWLERDFIVKRIIGKGSE